MGFGKASQMQHTPILATSPICLGAPLTCLAHQYACRPLRVLAGDCRVMVDVEARNAVIAMVLHLMSAFKMPARPRPPQVPADFISSFPLPCHTRRVLQQAQIMLGAPCDDQKVICQRVCLAAVGFCRAVSEMQLACTIHYASISFLRLP